MSPRKHRRQQQFDHLILANDDFMQFVEKANFHRAETFDEGRFAIGLGCRHWLIVQALSLNTVYNHVATSGMQDAQNSEGTNAMTAATLNPRITFDPAVMGGKACIRGMRVTAGMILGLLSTGVRREEILGNYPYLEDADITAALEYAAWLATERDVTTRDVG